MDIDCKGNCCEECIHHDEPIGHTENEFHSKCFGCVVISQRHSGRVFTHFEKNNEGTK